jgi:hypothetical protein
MYVCVCVYIYMYVHIYIFIYINEKADFVNEGCVFYVV